MKRSIVTNGYLSIMVDHIAARLTAALAEIHPTGEANRPPDTLERWSDELEEHLLTGATRHLGEGDAAITSAALQEAANALHLAIVTAVAPSCADGGWDDHTAANAATSAAAEALSNAGAEAMDLFRVASLLRAAGLFMRWDAQILQSHSASVASPTDLSDNHMTRLKFKSMLLFYARLLDMNISLPESGETYPDVPRFASICLFRATYGNDVMATTARRIFVNSLDGCSYLMKALLKGDQPDARLFSVVRNVHHLMASCPESVAKMESALEPLASGTSDGTRKHGLTEVLVATMAWGFRSEPPFPGGKSDRRSNIVLEILRALYALDAVRPSQTKPSDETMTQIGLILCDLLNLPNSDQRCYEIKLAVVALLLNAPKGYAEYLVEKGSVKPLVDILAYQTSVVVVERTGSSAEDAAAVVPILLVLLKLTTSNGLAKRVVKHEVFPPDAEETFEQMAEEEVAKGKTEGKANAKNMAPLDAPRGTLRWKIIRLMTWTESNVKRASCELLWALCDEDSTQFVLRTGFGNAIHFLGIRGHVNLPAGVKM